MTLPRSTSLGRSPWHQLIGEWEMSSPIFEGKTGTAVFEWSEAGSYVCMRSRPPEPAPASLWLIGADESSEDCTALYSDDRGISRVYVTRLASGLWTLERHGAPFSQRFEGRIDAGASRIDGAWYTAASDGAWVKDFDLAYTRRRT